MEKITDAAAPKPASGFHPSGAFTVLRVDGIATKRAKWRGRGDLAIQPAPNLGRGTYRVEVAGSLDELRRYIEGLSTAETLVWGLPAHPAGDFVTKAELAGLNGSAPATTITRTREHFAFAAGLGYMMLDFDYVAKGATLESLRELLLSVAPGLARLPMLAMSSASANLYLNDDRNPVRGLTGARIYLPVADARRIPELGARLVDRLILAGHGRADVSKTGQLLLRSPLDGAVWQPERVDYAAGAEVVAPLKQKREMRAWNTDATGRLDDAVLPPLSDEEQLRLAAVTAQLRAAAKAEATTIREAYRAERAAAGHTVSWADDGERLVLEGAHEIQLAGGELVTVDEILSDPARYHNAECADPLEPDYNNDDRIAVIRADGAPNIYSHAHGGQLFQLRPSREVAQRAAQEAFESDPDAAAPSDIPPIVAQMNEKYIAVPDGIYCIDDRVVRAPFKVNHFLRNEPGVFATWNSHPERARARKIVFDPGLPPNEIIDGVLNAYPGMALTPDAGADCSHIRAHIRDIVCSGDPAVERWVLSWLADIVQNPKGKCGTALGLIAPPGSGKSVLGAIMSRILGRTLSADIADDERLLGRFNGHLEHLLFVEAAETVWAGDARTFGKLKDLITATEMSYEVKGQTPHGGPNYTRILFTSNERRALPVTSDDRRFTVLAVSDRYADGKPGAGAYWSRLWAEINNGGCAGFMHYLQHYPVDGDLIRHPLPTEARREQQAENLDPLMRWLVGLADTPPARLELDAGLAPGAFPTDELYAGYLASIRGTAGARYPESKISFGRWLTSLEQRGLRIGSGRAHGRTDRRRTRQFPSLPALRLWLQQQAAMPEWDMAERWEEAAG